MKKMVWSIYKDTSKAYEDWEEADAAFFIDRDIVASDYNRLKFFEDGIHTVWFEKQSCIVEVVNGKFNIAKAKEAIGEAVDLAGYWGCYIEGFSRRNGKYVVEIGS